MPLTDEEKSLRKRQRMIEKAKGMQQSTYSSKNVAPIFQKMIRAEFAAEPTGWTPAVVNGVIDQVFRTRGQCVCITCGKVLPWTTHRGDMQTGHFIPGRTFSVLYDEDNVAPQCSHCNRFLSGDTMNFRIWIEETRGEITVDRLQSQRGKTRKYTHEELVDMRIVFQKRLDYAIEKMKG